MNLAQQESRALNCLLSVQLELPHEAARAESHGNPQTPALPVELPSQWTPTGLNGPLPGFNRVLRHLSLESLRLACSHRPARRFQTTHRGVPPARGRRLRARRSVAVLAPPLVSVAWLDDGRGGSSRVPVSNRVPLAYRASALPDAPTRPEPKTNLGSGAGTPARPVDLRGLEPRTITLQGCRSTSWSYRPGCPAGCLLSGKVRRAESRPLRDSGLSHGLSFPVFSTTSRW